MILLSVFCVMLSLEIGVGTPQKNRFKESLLQNEGNKEFNAEPNIGDPTNLHDKPNNQNYFISQENQKNVLMQSEDYEQFNTNNNPAALRNVNDEPNVISKNKESNQIIAERNVDNFYDESYISSLPQVNRIQTFRPKNGEYHKADIPRMGDILSEVNDPKNVFLPNKSNVPIIQERNPENQVMYKYNKQNSQVPETMNEKKEKESDFTQFDVPAATPEYVKSLFNDYKHPRKNNVKSTVKSLPRNDISNKNFQSNSQNLNEATFQNPSAEILYETGQAQPYEISDEPVSYNSRRGKGHASNILNDKERLKNLYLSSKPTKHYMIVYPDGRVEQVDNLDKIQKKHPNYVMLSAKELLKHGNPNHKAFTRSQGSVVKHYLPITTTTTTPTITTTATATTTSTIKPQLNSIQNTKNDTIDKVQTVKEQTLPYQIEPSLISTEAPVTSTSDVTKIDNVTNYNEDEVLTKLNTENYIQYQLQESAINDSQEKNKLNNYETTNPGALDTSDTTSTTSDIYFNQVSTSTHTPEIEDTVTTERSTKSIPTETTEIFNKNISNSLAMNNTESDDLSKEPEDEKTEEKNNTAASSNLTNTKFGTVIAENTTPTPKQQSNDEDDKTKKTKTVTYDLKTIQENSYSLENIETSDKNYDTNTTKTSQYSSSNKEESNFMTKSSNGTVLTFEDGTNTDGNIFGTETIITNYNNESSAQNLLSNNVTSSDDSTILVNKFNSIDIVNSSLENTETTNNTNPFNVSQYTPLTNNTLDSSEKEVNNTGILKISIVSNVTNIELDGKINVDNKPDMPDINIDTVYMDAAFNKTLGETYDVSSTKEELTLSNSNKSVIENVKQDSFIYTDDDASDALSTGSTDALNKEDVGTEADATNDYKAISQGGAVSLNEEDINETDTASDASYYLNSSQKGLMEGDENDVIRDETRFEITDNDNKEIESQTSDGNSINESSFWFKASDGFWNKLLDSNEHNSFYFLFPRPKPNTRETKKTIYPNGTTVIETIETVDKDDGEATLSKTVFTCGNCTTCQKTL